MCGTIEFFKFRKLETLSEQIYRYQCAKECWDDALETLKDRISEF